MYLVSPTIQPVELFYFKSSVDEKSGLCPDPGKEGDYVVLFFWRNDTLCCTVRS